MSQIQQQYPLANKELIDAPKLQADLNQLFTTINRLDKDNLYAPGGVFDFGGIFLDGVQKIQVDMGDAGSGNRAVNKDYLEEQIDILFDPADGNWHGHENKSALDDISNAGSGEIITSDERGTLPSQDQKDALDNANSPDSENPFATLADTGSSYSASATSVAASIATSVSVPGDTNFFYLKGTVNWSELSGDKYSHFIDCLVYWNLDITATRQLIRFYDNSLGSPGYVDVEDAKFEWIKTSLVENTFKTMIQMSNGIDLRMRKDNNNQFTIDNTGDYDMDFNITFHG